MRITADGVTQVREVTAGGSYLSHSDVRAHFGIGPATTVEAVDILWPSGVRQHVAGLPADSFFTITEGVDAPKPEFKHARAEPASASSRDLREAMKR